MADRASFHQLTFSQVQNAVRQGRRLVAVRHDDQVLAGLSSEAIQKF
jgi:hypothetical protein